MGFDVTQATLSRDVRELRLVKLPSSDGQSHYTIPEEWDHVPPLDSILPTLFISAEVVGNFVVVRTRSGGAQAVASGIDWEEFEGLAGTIAGDDTILLIMRDESSARDVCEAVESLAGKDPG
jgi:transcriptional regulator of arginine metabolism